MNIHELADLCGVSHRTIQDYVHDRLIPPPEPRNRNARYGARHVAAVRAILALKHNNTSLRDVAPFLAEEGIDITEYARRREVSIKTHGLGVG